MAKHIIGLSTFLADVNGNRTFYIEPSSIEDMKQGSRRATRTKTLDGGAVVYDAGFSPSDITFKISVRAENVYAGQFFSMLTQTYNLIRVCTDSGVYSAVPSRWFEAKGIATLEALVMEQLA